MLYVFNTWVLANLMYMAVLLLLYGNPQGEFFRDSTATVYISGTFFSFVLSLPALAGAFIVFRLLRSTRADANHLFIAWLVFAPLLAMLPWFLQAVFTGRYLLLPEEYKVLVPALIVGVLSVLLRVRLFFMEIRLSRSGQSIHTGADQSN